MSLSKQTFPNGKLQYRMSFPVGANSYQREKEESETTSQDFYITIHIYKFCIAFLRLECTRKVLF